MIPPALEKFGLVILVYKLGLPPHPLSDDGQPPIIDLEVDHPVSYLSTSVRHFADGSGR